jgi:hypothetical protein
MKGMGKAMPKSDSLIVPHASSIIYGSPAEIRSNDVTEILQQIQADLNTLKERK